MALDWGRCSIMSDQRCAFFPGNGDGEIRLCSAGSPAMLCMSSVCSGLRLQVLIGLFLHFAAASVRGEAERVLSNHFWVTRGLCQLILPHACQTQCCEAFLSPATNSQCPSSLYATVRIDHWVTIFFSSSANQRCEIFLFLLNHCQAFFSQLALHK